MLWTCERQVAGDLIKERRFICSPRRASDTAMAARAKADIRRKVRTSAFRRTPTDRLELLFGVLGFDSTIYTLTFEDVFLPATFRHVRREWTNFLARLKYHAGLKTMDYIYVIEGMHGDHRYHIHAAFNNAEVQLQHVRKTWGGGCEIHARRMEETGESFADIARYCTKERKDDIVHPVGSRSWCASRSLYERLPKPERWRDGSGFIPEPDGFKLIRGSDVSMENSYGKFRYCSFWRRAAVRYK